MPKKVILISGGSDGLGKAIAEKLAPDNRVVILSHNVDKLREVARELNCDFVEGELTDYQSLQSAVNQIIEKHHALDVLINNAGIWIEGDLADNDPRKIKEIIDVNTTGTIFLTRAVLPGMRFRKTGQIINIISQDGLCAKKNRSVYHASKWAITGFTKCLLEDLEEDNIKITGIYPGLIKTALFKKNGVERDLSDALDPKEVATLVEYVINLSPDIHLPEISIRNKLNQIKNMDDTNTPAIDLNIDPDMITPDGGTPQTMPQASSSKPPVSTPGLIDITPGSTDTFPGTLSPSGPLNPTSIEPKSVDITPSVEAPGSLPHLSEISPDQTTPTPVNPIVIEDIPSPVPPMAPPTTSISQSSLPDGNVPETKNPNDSLKFQTQPITQSSPLAEDPDLVKLIK